MRLYNRVLITFGIENQTFMLVEECAELLNAVAKMKRGRANKEDVITELADVSIMVEQLAFFYGWDEFKEERERKLTRLEDRINHHIKKDGRELEIEQAAILKNYKLPTMRIGFEQGAKWADKHPRSGLVDIEKACEYLESVMLNDDIYGVGNNIENLKELINDFKKAMNDEIQQK